MKTQIYTLVSGKKKISVKKFGGLDIFSYLCINKLKQYHYGKENV